MINNSIIEEVLKEFVEKHELNLKSIGGWDKNDFLDYSKQLLEKAIKDKEKEMLDDEIKFLESFRDNMTFLSEVRMRTDRISMLIELRKSIDERLQKLKKGDEK